MQSIFDAITEWLKGLLVEGIMGNLGGLFTGVNEQVGEIAAQSTRKEAPARQTER